MKRYQADPDVVYAEPDYVVHTTATIPNDPLFASQYDMTKISSTLAWDTQTNAGDVVVAIVDTGIDLTHPDLQGNLYTDANGVHGYTCINGPCVPGGQDDYGHGTHVAGTIGAATNNGIGVAGINWQVKLLAIKFLDSAGSGSISDAVTGFGQILALRNAGVNIRVTNNSWGGGGYSQALKDAMTAVENAGILDVCAAGNGGLNADVSPFYPAAFDNRGLISVLASDSNDFGASFTNFGLGNVDIAAPGVTTWSTVPTSHCALCDPTGYKQLSGTSMATPHVTGVVAALLHRNPLLTASQARDAILDPNSYDVVTDTLARLTSTGGRLNFLKAINNTGFLSNPALNNFPALTLGPDVVISAGNLVGLLGSSTDADNDPLRFDMERIGDGSSLEMFGAVLSTIFPAPGAGQHSLAFSAPPLARAATVVYANSVADGRGGGAGGLNLVTVLPVSNPAPPPSGTLSVSSDNIPIGGSVTVAFPLTVPAGGQGFWRSSAGGISTVTTGVSLTWGPFTQAGVVRMGAQAMDQQLNTAARQTTLVTVGGATALPPLAVATFDTLTGPAPLSVNIDLSGSTDPDGTIQWYFAICDNPGSGSAVPTPIVTCTYTSPGAHWMIAGVFDNSGNADTVTAFAMVTPPGAPNQPPRVAITFPADGAQVAQLWNIAMTGTALDDQFVSKVEVQVDNGPFALASGTAAWTYPSVSLSPGSHVLSGRATDNTGLMTTTASTVTAVPDTAAPAIAITFPRKNFAIPKGTTFVLASGTASDSDGVLNVQSRVDLGPLTPCTGTTSWSCGFPPVAGIAKGSHDFTVLATDSLGASSTASITFKKSW
ncbi:MAG TPA: S8 family serine peptidase [Candidatus Polarisedimenticolia bacterium]|nr:S8 family serine peptidase [Candidatus Polarisedimenticolia bacterium]